MMSIPRYKVSLLLLASLTACGVEQQEISIPFAARYAGQPLACSNETAALRFGDLRFFVTDIFLDKADGSAVRLALDPNSAWQNDDVVLLDLEDGSGSCRNGTAATNAAVTGRAPRGDYRGLRFTLGVPENLNHGDPLIAAAPLTDSAMHWHWRSGYKFLRASLQRGTERYRLHLGSARCHGVIGNLLGCDASNRPDVVLDSFDFENDIVIVDFAALLAGLESRDNAEHVCEMGPDEVACAAYRKALGLDDNGNAIEPAAIFRVETGP